MAHITRRGWIPPRTWVPIDDWLQLMEEASEQRLAVADARYLPSQRDRRPLDPYEEDWNALDNVVWTAATT